jgi:[protein-PII] uridylyltransferase
MTNMAPEEEAFVAAYTCSMPADYRAAFDAETTRAHAEIVGRRSDRKVHVEIWRELSERVVAIVVVADDKPGLLTCISAALVATQIDVVSAHAYCRTRADGHLEAVDLLWIRRLPDAKGLVPPIRARDIVAVAEAIERATTFGVSTQTGENVIPEALRVRPTRLRAESGTAETGTAEAPQSKQIPSVSSARIRFETNVKDGSTILTVEAVDRPGLLLAVTQALFRAGLQIVGLRATTERGCAVDRFTLVEIDGTPLKNERLLTLQTAILGALDEGTLAPRRRSIA